MANHKSAVKRARQNVKRRARNRSHRSRLRNQIKKLRSAVEGGQTDEARSLLTPTLSMVDRSVQKGVMHHRAAGRTKSRLSRLLDRAGAQS